MSSKDTLLRQLAAAAEQLKTKELLEAFDPTRPGSKATEAQQQIINAVLYRKRRYIIVRAGNQCLAKGTLVMTPGGAVPIELIQPGDYVYSEDGKPIKVLKTFENGPKQVYKLTSRGKVWATATGEHVWQRAEFARKSSKFLGHTESTTLDYSEETPIRRTFVQADIGMVEPFAPYALGALLGDGCSRERRLSISGQEGVPQKVASLLGGEAVRQHISNYTWVLKDCKEPSYYEDWCKYRYAHEKTVNLTAIKAWSRKSLIEFVAGVMDTDGCLTGSVKAKTVMFSVSMQATDVLKALEWAILSLWQVQMSWHIDDRPKYVNAPVWTLSCRNPHDIKRIYSELQPHLVSEQKHWKPEYDNYGKRSRPNYISLKPEPAGEVETYDLHVDSSTNLYLLANGLVTHNSGKSSTGAKAFATMFREDGVTWKRPDTWHDSLQFYILGRTSKQVEESLHQRIIRHIHEPDSIKEIRQGGALQKITNKYNGNTILYFSHHNTNQAQQAVQSFTGHAAWCDELPASSRIIEETSKRILINKGPMLLTFTPKVPNPEVKHFLDALSPELAMTIRINMLDNPAIDDEEKQVQLETARVMGESMMNTILHGDWLVGDRGVYNFRPSIIRNPVNYSPAWRHVESSDPAAASEHGLIVAAEDPATGYWYIIKADYLRSKNPNETINEVMRRTAGLNIVRRIYDTSATWYMQLAAAQGISYMGVYKKSDRKLEMIAATNNALGVNLFVSDWCTDLVDELQSAQWSETNPTKIAHAHDYHLCDALNYFVDNRPKYEGNVTDHAKSWDQQVREYNREKQAKAQTQTKIKRSAWGRPWTRW